MTDKRHSNEDMFLSCIIKNSNLLYSATEEIEIIYIRGNDAFRLYKIILDIRKAPGSPIERESYISNDVLLNYYRETDNSKVKGLIHYVEFLRSAIVKPQEVKKLIVTIKERYFSGELWKETNSVNKKIERAKGKQFKEIFQMHCDKVDEISAAYHGKKEIIHISEATEAHLSNLSKNKGEIAGVVVKRLPILMGILNGFQRGKLIVFAARPKVGKSTIGQNIATEISKDIPVLYIDTEQTEDEYRINHLSNLSYYYDEIKKQHLGISSIDIENGAFATDEYLQRALDTAKKKQKQYQKFHFYMGSPSLDAVKSVVSRFCHYANEIVPNEDKVLYKSKCVIFYDWLKTSTSMGRGASKSRQQEFQIMGDFADGLSQLAKKHDVPFVAFAQTNREDNKNIKESEANLYKAEIVQFDRVAQYCHSFIWMSDLAEKIQDKIGKENGNKLIRVILNRSGPTNTFGICYKMLGNYAYIREVDTLKELLKKNEQ